MYIQIMLLATKLIERVPENRLGDYVGFVNRVADRFSPSDPASEGFGLNAEQMKARLVAALTVDPVRS